MRLEIQCEDRIGMIREVLDLFVPHQIDLRLIEVSSNRRCIYCGFTDVDFQRLQTLLADLRRLKYIEDVKMVSFTPSEQETNTLVTILEALPEGVIALDTKGVITLATQRAAEDLNTSLDQLINQPLQNFIKGINFTKSTWHKLQQGISKQVNINGQEYLLEMKPIWVTSDEGVRNFAGAVIHLKSQDRLARQTANFKQATRQESRLQDYFTKGVFTSSAMKKMLVQAQSFAMMPDSLIVLGGLGSGKKDLIRAMHLQACQQWRDPMPCVFMAAEDVTEQDVFNLIEQAAWLVIEDIENLSEQMQRTLTKLLKGDAENPTDDAKKIRLLGVSNLDQQALLNHSNLTNTFFYAMSNLRIDVPALCQRKEDIPDLVKQCLNDLAVRYKKPVPKLTKGAWLKLTLYSWPGNLIELENLCRQLLLSLQKMTWEAVDIPVSNESSEVSANLIEGSLEKTLRQWEGELLRRLYPEYPSTRKLAKAVGMSHSSIANKLKDYGITS